MPPPEKQSPQYLSPQALKGMACAFFGFIFFSLQDVIFAQTTKIYPPAQMTWLNSLIALALVLGYLFVRKGQSGVRAAFYTTHIRAHIARGMLLALGSFFAVEGLANVPLPNFYTIIFVGPLIAVALSGFLLKEHVGPFKFIALLLGFAGLLIALRPGSDGFNVHSFHVLIAACCFSGTALIGRFVGRRDSVFTMILYPIVSIVVWLAPAALWHFAPIAPEHLWLIMLCAVIMSMAFFINAHAYKLAPIYLIAPCQFLQFLWGTLAHALLNKAFPEGAVVLGAAIIILSNFMMIYLQYRSQGSDARSQKTK